MGLTEELPLYRVTYRLILLLFDVTKEFSREYKYTLGQDIKRDAIRLVLSIYRANRSMEKRFYLEEYLDNFELLKLELRLCSDLKLITIRKYVEISQLMDQVGRQATGWKNTYK